MNAGYKRGSRACVHVIGGNLATRARHKSAEELSQGLRHASLRLAYRLKLLHALYSAGIPLRRTDAWHNTRALPKVCLPVTGSAGSTVPVRVRAETRTPRSLDEARHSRGVSACTRTCSKLVRPKRSGVIGSSIFGRRFWTMTHAYGYQLSSASDGAGRAPGSRAVA